MADTWEEYEWPDWVPQPLRERIGEFWSPESYRSPSDWEDDDRVDQDRGAPKTGAWVRIKQNHKHYPGIVGRWVHAWNNMGRVVGRDGEYWVASSSEVVEGDPEKHMEPGDLYGTAEIVEQQDEHLIHLGVTVKPACKPPWQGPPPPEPSPRDPAPDHLMAIHDGVRWVAYGQPPRDLDLDNFAGDNPCAVYTLDRHQDPGKEVEYVPAGVTGLKKSLEKVLEYLEAVIKEGKDART